MSSVQGLKLLVVKSVATLMCHERAASDKFAHVFGTPVVVRLPLEISSLALVLV